MNNSSFLSKNQQRDCFPPSSPRMAAGTGMIIGDRLCYYGGSKFFFTNRFLRLRLFFRPTTDHYSSSPRRWKILSIFRDSFYRVLQVLELRLGNPRLRTPQNGVDQKNPRSSSYTIQGRIGRLISPQFFFIFPYLSSSAVEIVDISNFAQLNCSCKIVHRLMVVKYSHKIQVSIDLRTTL